MQVVTTKDQGLYNKLSAAVHPEALAAGTLPQYNTIYREKISVYACRYIVGNIRDLFCHVIVKLEMRECLRVSKYQVTLHFVKRTTDAFVGK